MKTLKTNLLFNSYAMKAILSEGESCEEHDETKYSPMGLVMDFLCLNVGKITEKE